MPIALQAVFDQHCPPTHPQAEFSLIASVTESVSDYLDSEPFQVVFGLPARGIHRESIKDHNELLGFSNHDGILYVGR